MATIVEMRKDVVNLKADIEEELAKKDEAQGIVHGLANVVIRKLHNIDKTAVVDLKAEAFDEDRHLLNAQEQIIEAIEALSNIKEPTPEVIAEIIDLVLKIEEELGNEKDFTLSVGVKETSTDNPCDAVYLKNSCIDPGQVTLNVETTDTELGIKLETTNKPLSKHSLQKIQFSARGLVTGKMYKKNSGANPSVISFRKTDEDLLISVTAFGCNVRNSPFKWIHDDKVRLQNCTGVKDKAAKELSKQDSLVPSWADPDIWRKYKLLCAGYPEGSDNKLRRERVADLALRSTGEYWEGVFIRNNSYFPSKLLLAEGDMKEVEPLMRDELDKPFLNITKLQRLEQAKLDEVSKAISSSSSHAIFLALAAGSSSVPVTDGAEVESKPLSNLVSYLKIKEAAGFIEMNSRKTDQRGVMFVFPPCPVSISLLRRVAGNIGTQESKDADFLVVVVIVNRRVSPAVLSL